MNKPDRRYCVLHGRQTGENLLDFGVLTSIIGQLFEQVFKWTGLHFLLHYVLFFKIYIQKFTDNLKFIFLKKEHEWWNLTKYITLFRESKRRKINSILTFRRNYGTIIWGCVQMSRPIFLTKRLFVMSSLYPKICL